MARRVFISYQHRDQLKAKGFNLMRYNKHLDLEFIGRHLLDPVKSDDPAYIGSKIRERLKGSSVTVVLIGNVTAQSIWVGHEIRWSIDKNPSNDLLGVRLSPDTSVPDELMECGAEILNWYEPEDVHEFQVAIERTATAARSTLAMPTTQQAPAHVDREYLSGTPPPDQSEKRHLIARLALRYLAKNW